MFIYDGKSWIRLSPSHFFRYPISPHTSYVHNTNEIVLVSVLLCSIENEFTLNCCKRRNKYWWSTENNLYAMRLYFSKTHVFHSSLFFSLSQINHFLYGEWVPSCLYRKWLMIAVAGFSNEAHLSTYIGIYCTIFNTESVLQCIYNVQLQRTTHIYFYTIVHIVGTK